MEGNGTEVTQKIRSLITNKLVELGVYVDEELPDYIMVMVANKKSKIHMSDDLMLFLGNHTTLFTNWLNGILESLPSSVSDKKLPQQKSSLPDVGTPPEDAIRDERVVVGPAEEMEEVFSFKEEETDDFLSDELNREVAPLSSSLDDDRVLVRKSVSRGESRVEVRSEDPPKKNSTCSSIKCPSLVETTSTQQQLHHTVGSRRVAAKVRPMVQNRLAYEESEYDPRNPAVGSVASVVRVTERKWSVPPAMQANKLLLLKAMEDANKSVKVTSVRRPGTPVEPYQPTPIPQLAREETPAETLISTNWQGFTSSSTAIMDHLVTCPDEPDLRLLLKGRMEGGHVVIGPSPPPVPRGVKRKAEQQLPTSSEFTPKFVVTLDGIDPAKLVRDVIGSRHRVQDSEEENSVGEEELEEEESDSKVMERCRYWPACRNGDSCTRLHPTVPCKSFPSCRFGERCLYIHPNCRYDSRCSRKDCPYTHASKRNRLNPSVALVTSHSIKKKTPCKYFPNCNTYGCAYLHPKLCRFGGQCRAASCSFGHPLPSPEKMKWVAHPPS